jgi:hypothetical protein
MTNNKRCDNQLTAAVAVTTPRLPLVSGRCAMLCRIAAFTPTPNVPDARLSFAFDDALDDDDDDDDDDDAGNGDDGNDDDEDEDDDDDDNDASFFVEWKRSPSFFITASVMPTPVSLT